MKILPPCFPMPMSDVVNTVASLQENIKRTPPPPKPDKIPYPPTEENVPKLKDYIINKFSTSTFLDSDEPFPALKTIS